MTGELRKVRSIAPPGTEILFRLVEGALVRLDLDFVEDREEYYRVTVWRGEERMEEIMVSSIQGCLEWHLPMGWVRLRSSPTEPVEVRIEPPLAFAATAIWTVAPSGGRSN